jgi:predicted nucleotidyltransferase
MPITGKHIITSLKKDKEFLQKEMGVTNLALFGSYANNSQTNESDIDFLIELKDANYDFLSSIYLFLVKKFPGKKIQITRKGPHLSTAFLSAIQKDLIYV